MILKRIKLKTHKNCVLNYEMSLVRQLIIWLGIVIIHKIILRYLLSLYRLRSYINKLLKLII